MRKQAKVGEKVVTQSGIYGTVTAVYKEPLGHYWIYEILTSEGKTIMTKYVKSDK